LKKKFGIPFRDAPIIIVDAPYHREQEDLKHCIDFFLPQGTPLCAIQSGIVIACEDRYSKTFNDPRHAHKANRVIIRHDDGQWSIYAHLQHHSINIILWQQVKKGEIIARSGQTGYATYPHLHFGLYNKEDENIEVMFDQKLGKTISLQRAIHLASSF